MDGLLQISGAVAILSAIMAITRARAVHGLLYLVVSLLSLAVIFFLLGAPFAAALEVIIYAGAIMVLFIFVIMMLSTGKEAEEQERRWLSPAAWIGPACLSAILLGELIYSLSKSGSQTIPLKETGPKEVAVSLLGPYLIGVELASMLLLSGLVGAFYLGQRSRKGTEGGIS